MTWNDQFAEQPTVPSASTPEPHGHRTDGIRRAILTAGLAGALLVTGGVAVVWAASPDPSASPGPSQSTNPSNGGTTAPSNGGTTAPSGRQGHNGQPCPNMGGSGGSSGSGGQSTNPSDNASPAT
jgi:hypothetical protein